MRLCLRHGYSDLDFSFTCTSRLEVRNSPVAFTHSTDIAMESRTRALVPPPDAEAHNRWLLRVQKKAARIQKRRAKHLQARRRHRIPKATLVGTLFAALDTHNIGALGSDELNQFALLKGFQGDREDLFEEITLLLNEWGSTTAQSHSRAISLENFAQVVSRTSVPPLSKAELRRTIRFHKAPEVQGPLAQSGQGMWRSIKYMKIFAEATQWKQGICWHRPTPPWLLDPTLCSDPCCPLKTHPELFRRF